MYQIFHKIGISLSRNQECQFDQFTQLLLEWNQKMNLTAITEPEEILLKHYVDSALLFQSGVVNGDMNVIDVGCGAGFPSIPVKIIAPSLRFTLLDALNKRLQFLDEVIQTLNLEKISTLHLRAEDAGRDRLYREQFDLCVARAVAPLNILLEYCTPFLKDGGYFVALKGPDAFNELKRAQNAMNELCVSVKEVIETSLPTTDQKRVIVVLQKRGKTPDRYPRKTGKPSKKTALIRTGGD